MVRDYPKNLRCRKHVVGVKNVTRTYGMLSSTRQQQSQHSARLQINWPFLLKEKLGIVVTLMYVALSNCHKSGLFMSLCFSLKITIFH